MNDMQIMAYVSSVAGMPGYCAVSVDKPEYAKDNAKLIAKWIRGGRSVTRVTVEEAKEGMRLYLEARLPVKAQA